MFNCVLLDWQKTAIKTGFRENISLLERKQYSHIEFGGLPSQFDKSQPA
jgi:hypothetical protein